MNKTLIASELHHIASLANMMNSTAAQLKTAQEDMERALNRIKASENSILNLQTAFINHVNNIIRDLTG